MKKNSILLVLLFFQLQLITSVEYTSFIPKNTIHTIANKLLKNKAKTVGTFGLLATTALAAYLKNKKSTETLLEPQIILNKSDIKNDALKKERNKKNLKTAKENILKQARELKEKRKLKKEEKQKNTPSNTIHVKQEIPVVLQKKDAQKKESGFFDSIKRYSEKLKWPIIAAASTFIAYANTFDKTGNSSTKYDSSLNNNYSLISNATTPAVINDPREWRDSNLYKPIFQVSSPNYDQEAIQTYNQLIAASYGKDIHLAPQQSMTHSDWLEPHSEQKIDNMKFFKKKDINLYDLKFDKSEQDKKLLDFVLHNKLEYQPEYISDMQQINKKQNKQKTKKEQIAIAVTAPKNKSSAAWSPLSYYDKTYPQPPGKAYLEDEKNYEAIKTETPKIDEMKSEKKESEKINKEDVKKNEEKTKKPYEKYEHSPITGGVVAGSIMFWDWLNSKINKKNEKIKNEKIKNEKIKMDNFFIRNFNKITKKIIDYKNKYEFIKINNEFDSEKQKFTNFLNELNEKILQFNKVEDTIFDELKKEKFNERKLEELEELYKKTQREIDTAEEKISFTKLDLLEAARNAGKKEAAEEIITAYEKNRIKRTDERLEFKKSIMEGLKKREKFEKIIKEYNQKNQEVFGEEKKKPIRSRSNERDENLNIKFDRIKEKNRVIETRKLEKLRTDRIKETEKIKEKNENLITKHLKIEQVKIEINILNLISEIHSEWRRIKAINAAEKIEKKEFRMYLNEKEISSQKLEEYKTLSDENLFSAKINAYQTFLSTKKLDALLYELFNNAPLILKQFIENRLEKIKTENCWYFEEVEDKDNIKADCFDEKKYISNIINDVQEFKNKLCEVNEDKKIYEAYSLMNKSDSSIKKDRMRLFHYAQIVDEIHNCNYFSDSHGSGHMADCIKEKNTFFTGDCFDRGLFQLLDGIALISGFLAKKNLFVKGNHETYGGYEKVSDQSLNLLESLNTLYPLFYYAQKNNSTTLEDEIKIKELKIAQIKGLLELAFTLIPTQIYTNDKKLIVHAGFEPSFNAKKYLELEKESKTKKWALLTPFIYENKKKKWRKGAHYAFKELLNNTEKQDIKDFFQKVRDVYKNEEKGTFLPFSCWCDSAKKLSIEVSGRYQITYACSTYMNEILCGNKINKVIHGHNHSENTVKAIILNNEKGNPCVQFDNESVEKLLSGEILEIQPENNDQLIFYIMPPGFSGNNGYEDIIKEKMLIFSKGYYIENLIAIGLQEDKDYSLKPLFLLNNKETNKAKLFNNLDSVKK